MTHGQQDKNELTKNPESEVYMVDETQGQASQYPPERRGEGNSSHGHHDGYSSAYSAPSRRASDMLAIQILDAKVTRLEADVKHIRKHVDLILESLPSKNPDEHTEHHEDYANVLKARKEKEEEDRRLKKELKAKLVKTVAQAVFMAFMVILGLGLQAQFSKWVNAAIEDKAAAAAAAAAIHPNPYSK